MAGFSLGGSHTQRGGRGSDHDRIPPESLFLYGADASGNPSTTTRGFELWQQHQQFQRHHQFYSAAPTMLGISSDDPHHQQHHLASGSSVRSGGMRGSTSSAGSGSMSCQDCGNQAKKDCVHIRCRTCCKSRGFQCPTHVMSTWVPASKRRERQQQLAAAASALHHPSSASQPQLHHREITKRPRELATRHPTAITTTASGNFPAEVSSPAVFRCVRVSQMDDGDDEYAYQTAVSISGHLFQGILYDHGPESQYRGESSPTSAALTSASTSAALTAATATTSAGLMDPSSVYPAPLSAFMAGTQFFPHHQRP